MNVYEAYVYGTKDSEDVINFKNQMKKYLSLQKGNKENFFQELKVREFYDTIRVAKEEKDRMLN